MSQIQKLGPNSGGPVGDVVGPASSTDNAIARWDGTDGKLLQDSLTLLDEGTGATSGAVTDDLVTIALGGTAGAFTFQVIVAAFESGTPAAASYQIVGGAITDGAAATLVGTPDSIVNEDAALTDASVTLVADSNNIIVRATGVAALDINWVASVKYIGVN